MPNVPPAPLADRSAASTPTPLSIQQDPIPYCLACGYERVGLVAGHNCPECGQDCSPVADDVARDGVLKAFAQPFRRASREMLGRVPLGWWCLLPARQRLAARVQMVTSLTVATLVLLVLFIGGAHVRLWITAYPVRPLPANANQSGPAGSPVLIENIVLGGIVRGDLGGYRELGTRPLPMIIDPPASEVRRRVELVRPNWSPFFLSITIWSACLPAAGLLGLRFVLFPLTLRWQRRSLAPETRSAARVAADATIASAAIGCARVVVGFAVGVFLLATVAPTSVAVVLAKSEPGVILGLLLLLPPLLVSIVIWNDRARRVFAWPKLAALMTFASYFLGVAIAVGTIAATFSIAVRVMS